MIGQVFDTMIVVSIDHDKELLYRAVARLQNKRRQVSSAEGASRERGLGAYPSDNFEIQWLSNALLSIFRDIISSEKSVLSQLRVVNFSFNS